MDSIRPGALAGPAFPKERYTLAEDPGLDICDLAANTPDLSTLCDRVASIKAHLRTAALLRTRAERAADVSIRSRGAWLAWTSAMFALVLAGGIGTAIVFEGSLGLLRLDRLQYMSYDLTTAVFAAGGLASFLCFDLLRALLCTDWIKIDPDVEALEKELSSLEWDPIHDERLRLFVFKELAQRCDRLEVLCGQEASPLRNAHVQHPDDTP